MQAPVSPKAAAGKSPGRGQVRERQVTLLPHVLWLSGLLLQDATQPQGVSFHYSWGSQDNFSNEASCSVVLNCGKLAFETKQ